MVGMYGMYVNLALQARRVLMSTKTNGWVQREKHSRKLQALYLQSYPLAIFTTLNERLSGSQIRTIGTYHWQ